MIYHDEAELSTLNNQKFIFICDICFMFKSQKKNSESEEKILKAFVLS